MDSNIKKSDNIVFLSVGAGMFLWLAIVSLLYLLVYMILKTFLIIAEVDSLIIFWLNEILYLILFSIITIQVFAWIKNKPIHKSTAIRVLKSSVIALIIIQILQFVLSYYASDLVIGKFAMQFDSYYSATKSGYLMSFEAVLELVLYMILGIIIYKK